MNVQTNKTYRVLAAWLAVVALAIAGCTQAGATTDESGNSAAATSSSSFFTTDQIHQIDVQMDDADYQAMLDAYAATGDKEWVSVTVVIDGETYENAGLRLKGNSSLRQALAGTRGIQLSEDELAEEEDDGDGSVDANDPATMPWLIRLDKYVDGQEHLGRHDFVVRSNNTESYLNEAVAVALLEEAGLPTHRVAFTAFSVNGDGQVLRLVSEVQDDQSWNDEWFQEGSTWKADSEGDWDYHGEDGAEYESIWKQRTGDADMTPIVEFMDFINNSTDQEFEDSLGDKLDLDQFATYLAVEDLIGNWDTISGPGNNGYLHYDPETGLMTVVAWDHDQSFGAMGGGAGGPGMGAMGAMPDGAQMPEGGPGGGGFPGGAEGDAQMPDGAQMPEGMEPPEGGFPGGAGPGTEGTQAPEGFEPPEGMDFPQSGLEGEMPEGFEMPQGGFGGGMTGSNILETRFRASEQFSQMYDQAYARLQVSLIDSGFALDTLNRYADLLLTEGSELISAETVESDRARIESYLAGDMQNQGTAPGGRTRPTDQTQSS